MEAKAEWHHRLVAVFYGCRDLEGSRCEAHVHGELKPEWVDLEGLCGFAQDQLDATTIRQRRQLPWHLASKAVLSKLEDPLGQRKLVVRQPSSHGEQDREAAAYRLIGVKEALEIQIHNLMAIATPAADQPSPFRYDPQHISTNWVAELPVGIGRCLLKEWHGFGLKGRNGYGTTRS